MLNISAVLILMGLGQSAGSGRPADWKADSLVVAVRKADEIVERARLTADSFGPKPERSSRETDAEWAKKLREWEMRPLTERYRQPYLDCIATLQHLKLFSEPHHVAVQVVSLVLADNGELVLTGLYDQRTKSRTFFTPEESDEIQRWDNRRTDIEDNYARRLDATRSSPSAQNDDVLSHSRQLREYEKEREVALREILKASAAREARYKLVSLRCMVSVELAKTVDTKKLLSKKSVKLLVQVTDIELQPPVPEANIPATVSLIVGNIVDVERAPQSAKESATP